MTAVERGGPAVSEAPAACCSPLAQPNMSLDDAAVTARLIQALEARRPRARYFVTRPTYAADLMRRLLPAAAIDRVMRRS